MFDHLISLTFCFIHHLQLESPINSVENLPPASVESVSSAGVSSSLFGSEPMCTSSKSSESEPEESESHRVEEPVLESFRPNPEQSVVNEGMPVSSSVNTIQENLDSDESSGENHSDVNPRSVDSSTRALLILSDSSLSLRMFGSGMTNSGTGILVLESGSVSPDVFSSGVSEPDSREARRNIGGLFGIGPISSRRRHRRESEFSSLILTSGLVDDLGSRDRWHLDVDGDHHHDRHGHGYYRSHGRNEERRHFRSQVCVC